MRSDRLSPLDSSTVRARYLPPVLLRAVIEYVQGRSSHDEDYKGYLYGLAIFGCLIFMTLCENQCVAPVLPPAMPPPPPSRRRAQGLDLPPWTP